jgi:biotin carboxyl carrier protein
VEYHLSIGGTPLAVETENGGEKEAFVVTIADKARSVRCTRLSPYHLHLDIDGQSVNAYLCGNAGEKTVVINGVAYPVVDEDNQGRSSGRKRGGDDFPTEITPPMPAVVVRLLKTTGDTVEKGEGVVVVSAMKMESTIKSPFSGTVSAVNTAEGEKVMPGDILMEVAEEENDE